MSEDLSLIAQKFTKADPQVFSGEERRLVETIIQEQKNCCRLGQKMQAPLLQVERLLNQADHEQLSEQEFARLKEAHNASKVLHSLMHESAQRADALIKQLLTKMAKRRGRTVEEVLEEIRRERRNK